MAAAVRHVAAQAQLDLSGAAFKRFIEVHYTVSDCIASAIALRLRLQVRAEPTLLARLHAGGPANWRGWRAERQRSVEVHYMARDGCCEAAQ